MKIRLTAAALVALALSFPAIAAEMHKCPLPGGKVEFRDRPCDGAGGQKIAVQPNSVAPVDTPETDKKMNDLNKKIAARLKGEESDRQRLAAARARHDAECRTFAENIIRQEAWLGSISMAARRSASNEIYIQRQRQIDYGC